MKEGVGQKPSVRTSTDKEFFRAIFGKILISSAIFCVTFSRASETIFLDKTEAGMRVKHYKMRGLARENGKNTLIDLRLEFEGKRAFAIWDSLSLGNYQLKVRLELDPAQLEPVARRDCDYYYRGQLVLPRPQDN
jgi:hypothetical protein